MFPALPGFPHPPLGQRFSLSLRARGLSLCARRAARKGFPRPAGGVGLGAQRRVFLRFLNHFFTWTGVQMFTTDEIFFPSDKKRQETHDTAQSNVEIFDRDVFSELVAAAIAKTRKPQAHLARKMRMSNGSMSKFRSYGAAEIAEKLVSFMRETGSDEIAVYMHRAARSNRGN